MITNQTVAARMANNVLQAHQSPVIQFPLEIEYLIHTLTKASEDEELKITREQLGHFITKYIKTLEVNSENLKQTLLSKLTTDEYSDKECASYMLLHDYVITLGIDRYERSVVLGYLTAIDSDSLRFNGKDYYIDEQQHDTVINLRKKWYRDNLSLEYIPFSNFYNQREAASLT